MRSKAPHTPGIRQHDANKPHNYEVFSQFFYRHPAVIRVTPADTVFKLETTSCIEIHLLYFGQKTLTGWVCSGRINTACLLSGSLVSHFNQHGSSATRLSVWRKEDKTIAIRLFKTKQNKKSFPSANSAMNLQPQLPMLEMTLPGSSCDE